MAKGQQRSTREKKKPKQTTPKSIAANPPSQNKIADNIAGKKK